MEKQELPENRIYEERFRAVLFKDKTAEGRHNN